MIPERFDYAAPATLPEALKLLAEHGDDAKVLAGGHSLIPMMKLRLASPSVLIDIGRIPGLRGIQRHDDTVTIGATTTHAQIEDSEELRRLFPIMAEAATVIGDPLVRHRGTFGGSLAHADPAGDWPAVALALSAVMRVTGPDGERAIAVDDFFLDLFTSALEPNEILTAIDLAVLPAGTGMSYQKFAHPASGYAIAGAAAVIRVAADGTCAHCRVAITGAGATATRALKTEESLIDQTPTNEGIAEAAAFAGEGIEYLEDLAASARYRAHLVTVLTERAIRIAWERSAPARDR